eukprot:294524-Prymnesium_polylepis.1
MADSQSWLNVIMVERNHGECILGWSPSGGCCARRIAAGGEANVGRWGRAGGQGSGRGQGGRMGWSWQGLGPRWLFGHLDTVLADALCCARRGACVCWLSQRWMRRVERQRTRPEWWKLAEEWAIERNPGFFSSDRVFRFHTFHS